MSAPQVHRYWVERGVLLAGEYPGAREPDEAERRLGSLLDEGVRVFVDLTEDGELAPYDPILRRLAERTGFEVAHHRHPIRDAGVPASAAVMTSILGELAAARREGRVAYLHCWGGIGRTATVVGCLLREQGLDGEAALAQINALRTGSSKEARRSPETDAQSEWVRAWGPGRG